MNRKIIFHDIHFMSFYSKLDAGVKSKILFVFELVRQVEMVPAKFLSSVTGYDGLFEIRIEYQSSIYRVFCCFDKGHIVVLFNGYQKKTQKAPKKEIEIAMRLMKEYFELKINKR